MRALFSLLALILSFCLASPLLAQIEQDTTHWNDEELYEEDAVEAPTYFAVAGGPMIGLLMPNLDAFNKHIAMPFVKQDISNSILMVGGQGFMSVPWIKNLRVGGLGYGGRSEQCCYDTVVDGTSVTRTLEYNIGYGGISLDYVLPLNLKKFWIVPGIVLGLGSVELFAQQAVQRSQFDIQAEFSAAQSKNITHNYHSTFFLYMPQLQVEYSPVGIMMIRLSAGYQGTAMGTWEADRGVGLGNTDALKDINGNGLILNLGVFFGLFPS